MHNHSLLSRKQVAAQFGVSTETIKRWQRDGKILAVKVNSNLIRYSQDEVDRLIQQSTLHTPAREQYLKNLTLNSRDPVRVRL